MIDETEEPGAPVRIEHVHEEIGDGEAVEEIYDYLLYTWADLTARAYTDEMHTLSVMTRGPGGLQADVAPEIQAWMRARFAAVRALGPQGYEPLRRT